MPKQRIAAGEVLALLAFAALVVAAPQEEVAGRRLTVQCRNDAGGRVAAP